MNRLLIEQPASAGPAVPSAEALRLADLAGYMPGQDEPDPELTRVAELLSTLLRAPIAGVSLVDGDHVWLKARVGVDADCLEREGAFCGYAVDSGSDMFVVDDTHADPRFSSNPLVTDAPNVRSYAAAVLHGASGYGLGTLWVMNTELGDLSSTDREVLRALAALAEQRLLVRHQHPVTLLPSRTAFIDRLRRLIDERTIGEGPELSGPVAVGHIELRNLPLVRSAYGTEVVEQLLRELADRLRHWAGPTNLLVHLEGDRFGFALLGATEEIERFLIDLEDQLSQPIDLDAAWIHVASVVGISRYGPGSDNPTALLDQAAVAASSAMPIETNPVRTYQPSHDEQTRLWVDFQRTFPLDIEQQRVFPMYQPQVDVRTGALVGFEALARYRHETKGVIGPAGFIELARHTGLMRQLDLSILEATCSDLAAWRDQGLQPVPVAVNFSRTTVRLPSTPEAVAEVMARYDIEPHLLVVELVEDGESIEEEELHETCSRLIGAGVRVALDDFGTGRSNLASLRDLELDYLKVDRRFVHGVSVSEYAGGVLRLVAGFAELASTRMICEGVENEADLRWAIDAGCNYFQGWYFSRAVEMAAAGRMLRDIQPVPPGEVDLHEVVRTMAACTADYRPI